LAYIEINLEKIRRNAKFLRDLFEKKGISIFAITKLVLGDPIIAKIIVDTGIEYIGDSRINNIIKMREVGIEAKLILIRNPAISEISQVIKYSDISLNSELKAIRMLSEEAKKQKKRHGIIIMVEMGDLREGIMPNKLGSIVKGTLKLEGVELLGIGTNLKCFAGVIPDDTNMMEFSAIAENIENQFGIKLKFISGGNSANYNWVMSTKNIGLINNLRIGTAILMGLESIKDSLIAELEQNIFTLVGEIVQLDKKPKTPKGKFKTNAFGEPSVFKNKKIRGKGFRTQALLNVGRQDILEKGLTPKVDIEILGASSDYLIIDVKNNNFEVGDKIKFNMSYESVLRAMTSPFVEKRYING
jgi:predicted amino acid racemase